MESFLNDGGLTVLMKIYTFTKNVESLTDLFLDFNGKKKANPFYALSLKGIEYDTGKIWPVEDLKINLAVKSTGQYLGFNYYPLWGRNLAQMNNPVCFSELIKDLKTKGGIATGMTWLKDGARILPVELLTYAINDSEFDHVRIGIKEKSAGGAVKNMRMLRPLLSTVEFHVHSNTESIVDSVYAQIKHLEEKGYESPPGAEPIHPFDYRYSGLQKNGVVKED